MVGLFLRILSIRRLRIDDLLDYSRRLSLLLLQPLMVYFDARVWLLFDILIVQIVIGLD